MSLAQVADRRVFASVTDARVISYQAKLPPAIKTLVAGRNPARIEQTFRTIISAVTRQ
ncbi:MAG: hypothetical protein ACRDL5_00340 [Solirubrobacteraceae bacterium]